MSNAVIIGSGPAGVSAALYTVRAGIDTTILTTGRSALLKAEKIENYYGFAEPVSGAKLAADGLAGAVRLGVRVVEAEAVGLTFTDRLTVQTTAGDYPADAVLLAGGAARHAPDIPGLSRLEQHGVSYCAVCDAFFHRGKDVAVLGSGEYALHEAAQLLPVVRSVTLLTDGGQPPAPLPDGLRVETRRVAAILGSDAVEAVELQDGTTLPVSGVFLAYGVAGSTALARKIGAIVEGNRIVTDERMTTNIPGLYAAGDCTGGLLQISKAVYEGAKAATEMIRFLRAR